MNDHSAVTPLLRYPPSNNSLLSSGNTKKAIAYEPRTEAISPAINDDIIANEDSTSKSTKDEQTLIVDKLKKVEAEILQTDLQINRLRKQKAQLEQAASSASNKDDDQENICDTKQLSIAKLVYHENRSKAQKAHSSLDCLGGSTKDLPIYNQPSDNAIYHLNSSKFSNVFKANLIAYFKERLQSRLGLEDTVSAEYDRRMEKWLKSNEIEDSQPTKRMKDAKTREFFEKQFPELKKARESGERFSRVGQRVARSDAELDEILDGITEREDQDKKVKSYAVIPPMLEEMRSKKPKYINTNGYVEDIIAEYKEYQILNTWTDEEKDIFRENYLQNPKNFALIASMTSRKNVANCVQYYYMSKKSENYKQLLKRQQKRRTRSFVRPSQQTSTNATTEHESEASKTNDFGSSEKQTSGDNIENSDGTTQILSEQGSIAKSSALNKSVDDNQSNCATIMINDSLESSNENESCCCICGCKFSDTNQFRNVTRSNHQLYGIGVDAVKPGMKICYSCRFRHVRHPTSDEPPISPEAVEEEEESNAMEVDAPVIQISTQQAVIDNDERENKQHIPLQQTNPLDEQAEGIVGHADANKGQQRTCVRDIIYQAIEMSFQKPKNSEAINTPVKIEPIQAEAMKIDPIVAQHSLPNILPLKPVASNHAIPNVLPPHISMQNLAVDHQHQFQVQLQKQQQIQMEYNLRQQQQQQYLSQQHLSQQIQRQHLQQLQQQQQQQQLQQQQQQQLKQQQQHQQQQHFQHQLQQQHHQLLQLPTPQPVLQVPRQPLPPPRPIPPPPRNVNLAPLNLCREYNPLPQVRAQPKPQPPPMAHGAKLFDPPGTVQENGALNLSALNLSKQSQPEKNQERRLQESQERRPQEVAQELPLPLPPLPPPQSHSGLSPGSPVREDSKSPEMVIDESAASSDHEENK